jgi:hypothetical protein
MTPWKSKRQPPMTKEELREMLAEAVRNTQPQDEIEPPQPLPHEVKKLRP